MPDKQKKKKILMKLDQFIDFDKFDLEKIAINCFICRKALDIEKTNKLHFISPKSDIVLVPGSLP